MFVYSILCTDSLYFNEFRKLKTKKRIVSVINSRQTRCTVFSETMSRVDKHTRFHSKAASSSTLCAVARKERDNKPRSYACRYVGGNINQSARIDRGGTPPRARAGLTGGRGGRYNICNKKTEWECDKNGQCG